MMLRKLSGSDESDPYNSSGGALNSMAEEEKWLNTKASARYLGISKAGFLKIVQREGIIHETRQSPYGEEHIYRVSQLDKIREGMKRSSKRVTTPTELPRKLTPSTNQVTSLPDNDMHKRINRLVEAVEHLMVAQKENTDRLINALQKQQKALQETKEPRQQDTPSSELIAKMNKAQKNQTWVYIIMLVVLLGGAVGIAWAGVMYLKLLLH